MLETSRPYIRSVARKIVKSEADLEDVVQDVMLQAHRYRDGFRGDSAYKSWLYRITVNVALNFVRRGRYRLVEVSTTGDEDMPLVELQPSNEDLEEKTATRALIEDARKVVDGLGEKYVMFWWQVELGMTEPEIASALGVPVSTVKARLHNARVAVRKALAQEFVV